VNGETPRNATISFDFLERKKYMATIYADAKKRITKPTNPQAYSIRKIAVTNKSKISQLRSWRRLCHQYS
jgi:hypothetical protein